MNIFFMIAATCAALLVMMLLAIFKLREKYMVAWIGLAAFVFLFGFFFEQVNGITHLLGFKVYSNFIFLFFGVSIGILVFQLSLNLSRQEDKIQTLVDEISILRLKIKKDKL